VTETMGLRLFYLNPDDATVTQRRTLRATELGKAQNETWVRGRATKHATLAKAWSARSVRTEDDELSAIADVRELIGL
jgi:hypothetical protein